MDRLFKERRKELKAFQAYLGRKVHTQKKEAPEGLYVKCPHCHKNILTKDLKEHLYVCPSCGQHLFIRSSYRLKALYDEGLYKEYFTTMKTLNPLAFEGYDKKIEDLTQKTGLNDPVVVTSGKIHDHKCLVVVMDNRFMMASMGSVAGEKITRAFELATKKRWPLILFTSSGGARMQEGLYSLMQMAKTCAALKKHSEAGLLYISYLTHPTTGGVTASFAMLGDINIAEPGALIGFAGPRVIESTMKQSLPAGFQRAEFLEDHGFCDMIVERKEMRQTLATLLDMHCQEEERCLYKKKK